MDRKKAIYVTEDEGRETLRETQLIKDKGTKRLEILKALDYDDFGQMYVEYTRPYKLS